MPIFGSKKSCNKEVFNKEIDHLQWLISLLLPYRQRIILDVVIVITRAVLSLCPAVLTRMIIDQAIPYRQVTALLIFSTSIVVIPILAGVAIIWDLYISNFVLKIAGQLRSDLYNGIQYCSLGSLSTMSIGDLLVRMQQDTESTFLLIYRGIDDTLWATTTIIAGIIAMIILDWQLAVLIIVLLCIQTWAVKRIGKDVKKASKILTSSTSGLVEQLRETITGVLVMKSMCGEYYEVNRLVEQLDRQFQAYQRKLRLDRLANFITALIGGLVPAVLYFFGGLKVINGTLSIGTLVALVALYVRLRPAAAGCHSAYLNFKSISPSLTRIREIYFPRPTADEGIQLTFPLPLHLCDVSFNYGVREVLKNITFTVPATKMVALVGHIGSGKSTLIDIILGLREPKSGSVYIGETPLNQVSSQWLRKNVIAVPQDIYIQNGTLLDNITYGMDVDDVTLQETLFIVGLQNWVSRLPDGLQTYVGEQGFRLSGGECQRISLARALLRRPTILLLDEATSALDTLTETRVLSNLRRYLKDSTLMIATHHLSVSASADYIIVLKEGCVVEVGSHTELMSVDSIYASLVYNNKSEGSDLPGERYE